MNTFLVNEGNKTNKVKIADKHRGKSHNYYISIHKN